MTVRAIRIPRNKALEIFEPLHLRLVEEGIPFEVVGSLRRQEPEVKDIDLISWYPAGALLSFLHRVSKQYGLLVAKHFEGNRLQLSVRGLVIKTFLTTEFTRGAALLAWTGHVAFVRWLRKLARGQGYVLSPGGLLFNGNVVASVSEGLIFDALGLDYIPPDRRGFGSIAWRALIRKNSIATGS